MTPCRAPARLPDARPQAGDGEVALVELQPQQPLRVAARDRGDGRCVKALHPRDMPDRIVVRHVEGIVGAHDDAVGAVEPHQLGELIAA